MYWPTLYRLGQQAYGCLVRGSCTLAQLWTKVLENSSTSTESYNVALAKSCPKVHPHLSPRALDFLDVISETIKRINSSQTFHTLDESSRRDLREHGQF